MTLIQIAYSHNCLKVRVGLALKGIAYETRDIPPADRAAVVAASGQGLVPVLLDEGNVVTGSTRVLLYLEERHPARPLLPVDPGARAECLLLSDWADRAFMEVSRRIAYHNVFSRPGRLGELIFPADRGLVRRIKEPIARRRVSKRFAISPKRHVADLADAKRSAALAVARLGGRPWLLGSAPTLADVSLASMSAPLIADAELRESPDVAALLAWGRALVPAELLQTYQG